MACCQDKHNALATIKEYIYPWKRIIANDRGLSFCITSDGALTVIDDNILSGDYFSCEECGFGNYKSFYIYPTSYTSCSRTARCPVKAHRKMLNLVEHVSAFRYSEPNFGAFISGWYYPPTGKETKFIIYCPTKTIHAVENNKYVVKIDDKIAICFVSKYNEVILINSDCEIIETVCVLESEPRIFKMPGGYLEFSGKYFDFINPYNLTWSYTSKALNTKPAAAAAARELD
jgi:hypothetical protein